MIIILFTPYKTGSTNIFFKFKENNCNCVYEEELLNNLNFSLPSDKISVIKMHSKDKFSLKYKLDKLKLEPDLIITCVRNLDEIYISGYYQNLFLKVSNDYVTYPYHLGKKEEYKDKKLDFFINHFKSFDWTLFKHLSVEENFKQIEECYNINLWEKNFDIEKGYEFYDNILLIKCENVDSIIDIVNNKFNLKLENKSKFKRETVDELYKNIKKEILNSTFFCNLKYYNEFKKVNEKFYYNFSNRKNLLYILKKNSYKELGNSKLMYNGQIGQGCPHIEVNNVDYQLHDIDHFNYNLYNFYNKNIFFRGPHNIDINNDKFFVSIGAAQSFGRAVKNDFNSIIEQNINLKHINMGIGGVGYEFYNNKFLLNIINKAEFVIINTMSPRSINFDNYISNGSVNFHIPETNSYLYWRRFYKEYLVNKGLTDDVISEKIYKNYFEQLLSLIKKINSEIIFIYLNTKGNNENIEIFPQYFNKKYLENLKKIVGNYISVSSENYKNELRSYYPNQLSNEIVSRLILKYLNLKNNYLFSHFKLSQSYKYINDLINSDNYKEFILSKFNVDDSINENAELLIPKIIHQTGPDNYKENELSVKSIESFKSVYNDWEHKFWTDNDIEKFIKDEFEWFYDCWKNLPYPIMKFDAVRYCWLYKFGGMYTDIDTEPGIRNDKYLTGKEVILIINREKIFNENRFDELHVDNWWMCSSPNQEIWLDMIHYIKNYNHNYGKHFDILYRTGPYGLGLVVANYIMKNGDEKIKFLSRDKSNALLRESRTDIDKTYLIVHRSEGSWAQKI